MRNTPACGRSLAGLIFLISFVATTSIATVTTGIPPYRSFGGGPDVINLGTLNVHYSFPVFSKAGRGTPFSYALAYDSSVWTPIAGGPWVPTGNWGLRKDIAALVGYVILRTTGGTCKDPYGGTGVRTNWTFTAYVDAAGTSHPIYIHTNIDECADIYNENGSAVASDGSGIRVDTYDETATVTLKSGEVIHPQTLSGINPAGDGSSQDSNGNKITTSTTNGTTTITDTLGTTALTITGTAPSPVYYKYTDPFGALMSVTVTYATYTVQTAFQCNGINEYGPLSNSLPDKITYPDGTYYQFTYETTPGDTHSPHYVTGRLASLLLPTGGAISYTYTGINCADGSAMGFDRTTPDGTWQYRRTGTSPAYTTTITTPIDPQTDQANNTVINFQGEFEVSRQAYQGAPSGTPLAAAYTCYNGNGVGDPTSCVTIPVASPFGQITNFRQFNGGPFAETDTLYDGYGDVTESDQYDFGASAPTRKTTTLYGSYVAASDSCTSLGNNIVDHPCKVTATVNDGNNNFNLKAKTTYGYDETAVVSSGITTQHASVTGSRGNLTTVATYNSPTTSLMRTFKNYDHCCPN